jgi:hypothetical protein
VEVTLTVSLKGYTNPKDNKKVKIIDREKRILKILTKQTTFGEM